MPRYREGRKRKQPRLRDLRASEPPLLGRGFAEGPLLVTADAPRTTGRRHIGARRSTPSGPTTGVRDYHDFMKKYMPDTNPDDEVPAVGYTMAQLAAYLLQQCGDNLTRENLMHQALSLHDVSLGLMLPGITSNGGPPAGDLRGPPNNNSGLCVISASCRTQRDLRTCRPQDKSGRF